MKLVEAIFGRTDDSSFTAFPDDILDAIDAEYVPEESNSELNFSPRVIDPFEAALIVDIPAEVIGGATVIRTEWGIFLADPQPGIPMFEGQEVIIGDDDS